MASGSVPDGAQPPMDRAHVPPESLGDLDGCKLVATQEKHITALGVERFPESTKRVIEFGPPIRSGREVLIGVERRDFGMVPEALPPPAARSDYGPNKVIPRLGWLLEAHRV